MWQIHVILSKKNHQNADKKARAVWSVSYLFDTLAKTVCPWTCHWGKQKVVVWAARKTGFPMVHSDVWDIVCQMEGEEYTRYENKVAVYLCSSDCSSILRVTSLRMHVDNLAAYRLWMVFASMSIWNVTFSNIYAVFTKGSDVNFNVVV